MNRFFSAITPVLTSTMIVTEKEGMAKKGSAINLITVDWKLRYELNEAELDKRNVKLFLKNKKPWNCCLTKCNRAKTVIQTIQIKVSP